MNPGGLNSKLFHGGCLSAWWAVLEPNADRRKIIKFNVNYHRRETVLGLLLTESTLFFKTLMLLVTYLANTKQCENP